MCPSEKRWGKCIPVAPAWVGFIRALLWSVGARRATSCSLETYYRSRRGCERRLLLANLSAGCKEVARPHLITVTVSRERGKKSDKRGRTQTLAGWSAAEWVVETWCGVQCADLQMVLWIQSLIEEETCPHSLRMHPREVNWRKRETDAKLVSSNTRINMF